MKPGLPVKSESYFHEGDRSRPSELSERKSTVHDFWKWAFSFVNENTLRGILAQYLVAWAIGDDRDFYDPWRSYDLTAPTGKRIEIKTTAKAQVWEHGEENRKPKFEVTEKAYYTHEKGLDYSNIDFHADIYVLCHYKYEDSNTMDATNLSHWEFWVLTKEQLLRNFQIKGKTNRKKRRRVLVYVNQLRNFSASVDAQKLKDTILSL